MKGLNMSKSVIFTKIMNYNNQLENILEKKAFSEEAKNLLLSMLYKIETAYQDYRTVKRNAMSKERFLQELLNTIEYLCQEIEFVKPMTKQSKLLQGKRFFIEGEKIICYQNEISLLQALLALAEENIEISNKYDFFAPSIIHCLQQAFLVNDSEVIRDFNGFSWDILVRDIENLYRNIVYQNMLILLGNKFIEDWLNKNNHPEAFEEEQEEEIFIPINNILSNKKFENIYDENEKVDYIEKMKMLMTDFYGEKNTNQWMCQLLKTAIAIYSNENEEEKEKIIVKKQEYEKQLAFMQDKRKYISEKTEEKKKIVKRIGKIDELINNNTLLKQEYVLQNSKLPNEKKFFSISHFADKLEKERKICLKTIQEINQSIEPEGFSQLKTELQNQVKFYQSMQIAEEGKTDVQRLVLILQKIFLRCFTEKVKKAENKKEMIEYIYEFRYYLRLPIGKIEDYHWLYEEKKLAKPIEAIEKLIIHRAIQLKVLNSFSEDKNLNDIILKNIFTSKIIQLEKMQILLKYDKGILDIEVYDENVHEVTVKHELKEKTELNVKLKKKIKIFN